MLTGLVFLFGMFIALAVGAAMVDNTWLGDLIDYLTRDLPMNWVRFEDKE